MELRTDQKQEDYEAELEGEQIIEHAPQQASQIAAAEPAEHEPAKPLQTMQAAQHLAQQAKPHVQQPLQPKPAGNQIPVEGKLSKLMRFYHECVRVFKVTKKPNKPEFLTTVKIAGLGILAIGAIGFLMHLLERGIRLLLQ